MLSINKKKKEYLLWLNSLEAHNGTAFIQYNFRSNINTNIHAEIKNLFNTNNINKTKINYFFLLLLSKNFFQKTLKGTPIYMFPINFEFVSFSLKLFLILFFVKFNKKDNSLTVYNYAELKPQSYLNNNNKLLLNLLKLSSIFINNSRGIICILIKIIKFKLLNFQL